MGKNQRERIKNNLDSNRDQDGESSSASSSLATRRSLRSNTETVNVNVNDKANQVQGATKKKQKNKATEIASTSQAKGQGQGQGQGSEVKKIASLDNLPPEMLMKILKCVDTRSLFHCRLVNRNFSAISSGILTKRSDALLRFDLAEGKNFKWFIALAERKKGEFHLRSLKHFVKCMKKSENCPFSRFSFEIQHPSFFNQQDWIAFLRQFAPPKQHQNQNQSTKIKCLNLEFHDDDIDSGVKKLADLLLNKIPDLEEFGLTIVSSDDVQIPKLFSPSQAAKMDAVPVSVQLPHLKVLRIDDVMFSDFPGVVADLLNAVVNLRSIRGLERLGYSASISDLPSFQFLHSLGKLALLQIAKIKVDQEFLSALQRPHVKFTSEFKLRELKLKAHLDLTCCADATNFISSLLESCKETLRELKLGPLGFLPGLQLPNFQNVIALKLTKPVNYFQTDSQKLFFPPETRSREIFPAVTDLDFQVADCSAAFPQEDSIPRLPNVRTLCLFDQEIRENSIRTLALMCPNLENLKIAKDVNWNVPNLDFLFIGRSIWTHMQQLVSLEVDLKEDSPEHAFPALDSLFTGISPENCRGLNHLKLLKSGKNQQPRRKDRRHGKNLPVPKSEPTTEKEHASILDMKNLKKLTVNPYLGSRRQTGKTFFANNITWISEEYAFKLMPQLEFNGRKQESAS